MVKIKEMGVFGVRIPLAHPMKMSGIVIQNAENLLVSAKDADGRTGWGEAASAPTMTGETIEGMVAAARILSKHLAGFEYSSPEEISPAFRKKIYGNYGVKAAFETALLDLLAQSVDKPLFELLGGAKRANAPVLTMVSGDSNQAEKESAIAAMRNGFTAFKVKIGVGNPEDDLERCKSVRSVLGSDVQISADANQGYNSANALKFAKGAEEAGLDFMEQLVDYEDLESMAACASSSKVPLGADEGLHCIKDIENHHKLGAASGGSLKIIKLGGLLAVMKAAQRMVELGMSINLAGKVAETSIGSAAIAHLAIALPALEWGTSITNQYLADDVSDSPVKISDGSISAPDGIGLGSVPNERKLEKYRIKL